MNQLAHETSPYLLQHAHNPVHWYAWKPEAFERARREDKPILVSIGYSTCHWCHVMERESFENEDIAAFMNEHFINIKVDREERPDVDQIYMEAVQAISGSGGWPLNCFLLPDGRPFYGGTYFPPRPAYNRPSWMQVLQNIYRAYYTQREVVQQQAERLMTFIKKADGHLVGNAIEGMSTQQILTPVLVQNIAQQLLKNADREDGGFGGAPKFPAAMAIQFLLEYDAVVGNSDAQKHALFSLDQMIYGGIYDQIGGGFARYATDKKWLVPHFEKMLYDNALLVRSLADAYQATGKELYQTTISETLQFVERELRHPEGGFYAALDADSEGTEGKFYVWQKAEIMEVLGEEGALFCAYFDATEEGNWEGKVILNRPFSATAFCAKQGIEDVPAFLEKIKQQSEDLLRHRSQRVRPGLDDKIIMSWNALMCTAYLRAYHATQNDHFKGIALQNAAFLQKKLVAGEATHLFHTYKDGKQQYKGFLEDYAFWIETLLMLYYTVFDTQYLDQAQHWCQYVIHHFMDDESGLFFFTDTDQTDIVVRKKEIYDSATPSGNATMLHNLQQLALLLDNQKYAAMAERMMTQMAATVERYPSSFARWASAMMAAVYTRKEIAILGSDALHLAAAIRRKYLPHSILMASTTPNEAYPLLEGRYVEDNTQIYLCSNYTCQKPVQTLEAFDALLK